MQVVPTDHEITEPGEKLLDLHICYSHTQDVKFLVLHLSDSISVKPEGMEVESNTASFPCGE